MKIDTDKTMTFHYSIGRRIFLLIVYFLAFFLSIFLIAKGLEGDFKGKNPIFIASITAPFTLVQFIVSCFLPPKEDNFKFEVSPDGIYDDYISSKVIPWSHIEYFDTYGGHFNKMLRMKIDPQAMIEPNKAPLYIRANLESRFFQSDVRYLNHKGLGISFDYLTWVLGAYAKAHGCPAAPDLEKSRPSPSRSKTLYGLRRDLY